ncbi:hypothetical protein [Methanococcus aeolicus]|uniref:hypothetical protein n=1 Tax=Methanococcus aeolicus TaxID=42879 RepID=UPI000321E115|nr:hypothetical protein [Methanococcus aeolicus]UXM84537.1 hypothetical protein N6C89_07305 [Methanococcus aeolicus]
MHIAKPDKNMSNGSKSKVLKLKMNWLIFKKNSWGSWSSITYICKNIKKII